MRRRLPYIWAVDFDGTLCEEWWPEIGEPNLALIDFLKAERNIGNLVILFTMRSGASLDAAVEWCKRYGLYFDAINDNVTQIKGFYGGNPRKVFANEYIDDHNTKTDWRLPYYSGKQPAGYYGDML